MKWFLLVTILLISTNLLNAKRIEKKLSAKKATSLKPTKSPKSVVDQFKDLPPDDVAFIKELDKQFKNHGNNIKFQIVKENSTSSKNIKRTINGETGYGYQNNQHSQNYYFSPPKFQIYPYSQHDIPPAQYQQRSQYQGNRQHYQNDVQSSQYKNHPYLPQPQQQQGLHTSVEISPSHGFELKQTTNGYEAYPSPKPTQLYGAPEAYQQEEPTGPVIVLRIPGPHKYAAHLQALLQQYLEVRAAQYIKAIQEHESQAQIQQHQQVNYDYEEQAQQSYATQEEEQPQYQYVRPSQQLVYQSDQQHRPIEYQYETAHASQVQQQEPEIVYHYQPHPVYHEISQQQRAHNSYPHSIEQEYAYRQHQRQHSALTVTEASHLQTTENFPSDSHTKVYFTNSHHQSRTQSPSTSHHHQDDQIQVPLALVYQQPPHEHPKYQTQEEDQQSVEYYYDDAAAGPQSDYETASQQSVISITQRTTAAKPYNYHAHQVTSTTAGPTKHSKRRQASFTEEQYKKLNTLITRMKNSKTTQDEAQDE